MITRRLSLALLATSALGLAACSKQETASGPSAAATPIDPAQAYDTVAREAKGFTAGAMMSAHTVYVLFDPQCPHCSHLWESSLPLQTKVKFVWAPVAILGPKSLPQGAALMQAANPVETMTAHEKSLLAGQGGMAASASIPAEIEATIKANTGLLDRLGADSVPFVVARHASSGQVITRAGSMDTAGLANWLGMQP
ncbi:thioredoxin fold domain-containing protein [Hydrogenophaga pseudoflava]|uniref:thioredoxin fold domain-containing protein n=1 Tax=Hydrogenophaga pseudoflava TaxID=47421 RepID=UPI0027E4B29F|nr:thioredoxin fold domain-containing protein [Hydrogenophaga pseudoflava]MDQ7745371.1 thioredoxin fold domain-containing protein [Hydrogenophaga pseudoflava]